MIIRVDMGFLKRRQFMGMQQKMRTAQVRSVRSVYRPNRWLAFS